MKRFQFSLQTVLSYKQQVLDSLQVEHATILQKVRAQEEHIAACWTRYRAYNEEFRKRSVEGIPVMEARVYENGLRGMEETIQQETETLEQLQKQEDEKRNEVIEARKETASIEMLKDKKLAAYHKEEQKADENFVEEFVSAARTRNGTSGA